MTIIASLTPDQFSTTAAAWISAGVGVIIGLSTAAAVVLPKIAALKAQVDALFHSRDTHTAQIAANAQNITQIALAAPAPVALVEPVAPSVPPVQ